MSGGGKRIGVVFVGRINPIEGVDEDEIRSVVSYICDSIEGVNTESEIKFSYLKPKGKKNAEYYGIPGIAAEFCRGKYNQVQNESEMFSFEKLYKVIIGKFPDREPGLHGFKFLKGKKSEGKPTEFLLKYNL